MGQIALLLGLVILAAEPSFAAISFVTTVATRAAMTDAQTADWALLGPPGTSIPQPFTVTADGGFQFTVYKNNSLTAYIRANEGNGFLGDFFPSEPLLFSTSLTAIDIKFPSPVTAVGANVQLAAFPHLPQNWTPYMLVKRTDGSDLQFQLPGDTNNGLQDGSAPFVGVRADRAVITEVLFDSFRGGNVAMNRLSIVVPEPLSGAGAFALIGLLMRRPSGRAGRRCRGTT